MKIADLVSRFKFYAQNHVDLRHVESDKRKQSFFHLEGEELQLGVQQGIKLPCLLLQTPETDKTGGFDQLQETTSFTYVVLKSLDKLSKAQVLDDCKSVSDDILSLFAQDFVTEVFEGSLVSTSEGMAGPFPNKLYGWGVSMVIEDAFNAEVNINKWLHLADQGS